MSDPIYPQLLEKPPRLKPDDTGYDWKELDRWHQKLFLLLGSPEQSKSLNVVNHLQNLTDAYLEKDFVIDRSREIMEARQLAQNAITEAAMVI